MDVDFKTKVATRVLALEETQVSSEKKSQYTTHGHSYTEIHCNRHFLLQRNLVSHFQFIALLYAPASYRIPYDRDTTPLRRMPIVTSSLHADIRQAKVASKYGAEYFH